MIARTHSLVAFSSLLVVSKLYPQTNIGGVSIFCGLAANTIGSMLPDIDQASNKLWDMLPLGDNIGKFLGKIFISHRSISHSLVGLFVADKLLWWLIQRLFNQEFVNVNIVYYSVMIGYVSHMAADALTEEGIPLLFPLKFKFGLPPIKSWRIKSGHWFEKLVITPSVIVFIAWFVVTSWGDLSKLL